jgi:WS/DGAT/MGAT family acyltransferase
MLERRLPLVPRFRQRLATVPFGAHRPMWIDDDSFDIDAHLQHVALFEPSERAMLQLVGRILSNPLCKTRPLWEMWLITGLQHNRFAVLSKTHHSLWDGISGVDLHAVLLDSSPDGRDDPEVVFEAEPEPSGFGMLVRAARDRLREATDAAKTVARAARDPRSTIDSVSHLVRDASGFATSFLRPAPRSSLNAPIGSRRRFALARTSLNEVKDLRTTLGVSVNDVILAGVAGALREWQIRRGQEPHDVKVMVPVSIRNGRTDLTNRVAMVVVKLPVEDRTSLMRLDRVHRAMERAKTSGHVAAGEAITNLSGFMPPTAIAAMTRAQSLVRPFNLVVTNVAGPSMPLYLLGRRLVELFGQAPLATNQGLSIAALSYDGRLGFGLLGDHDKMGDLDVLARSLESSLDDLLWHGGLDTVTPSVAGVAQTRPGTPLVPGAPLVEVR